MQTWSFVARTAAGDEIINVRGAAGSHAAKAALDERFGPRSWWVCATGASLDGALPPPVHQGTVVADQARPPVWHLVLVEGPPGSPFGIDVEARSVVGRSRRSGANVILPDPSVSRVHATLRASHDVLLVEDEASRSGTLVDGVAVEGVARAVGGELLRFGDTAYGLLPLSTPAAHLLERGPLLELSRTERPSADMPHLSPASIRVPPVVAGQRLRWSAGAAALAGLGGTAFFFNRNPWLLLPMVGAALALVLVGYLEGRGEDRRAASARRKAFEKDMQGLASQLEGFRAELLAVLEDALPPPFVVASVAAKREADLWRRTRDRPWFGCVRVGSGARRLLVDDDRVPSSADDDPEAVLRLQQLREAAVARHSPIWIDVLATRTVALDGESTACDSLCRSILVQLAVHHSPADLEIVCLGFKHEERTWLRWLPHAQRPAGGASVGVAEDASDETSLIERVLRSQPAGDVLLVVAVDLRRTSLPQAKLDDLLRRARQQDSNLAAIVIAGPGHAVPVGIDLVVAARHWGADLVDHRTQRTIEVSAVEGIPLGTAARVGEALAPLFDPRRRAAAIPNDVQLDSIAGGLDEESVGVRWGETADEPELTAIVGYGRDGPIALSLGAQSAPHALVGGAASSGKSEFLRAWIAAIAARYGPERVNFLLFDLGGERSFGPAVDLPHVLGLITSADPFELDRAKRFIRAEMDRRGDVFKQLGSRLGGTGRSITNLSDARRHFPKDAPPSLLVIVDEMAEITASDPEFLKVLTSTAAAGRGWGIHAVLATQSPDMHIDEAIRRNIPLRVVFRLEDERASEQLVGTPAATRLERKGHGFIRREAGPAEEFQAAYTASPGGNGMTQLDHLVATAKKLGDGEESPRRVPWTPTLPRLLLTSELPESLAIGLADRPGELSLKRPSYVLRPDAGAVLLLGGPRSGLSTALLTVAHQLAASRSADDLDIVAFDFGPGHALTSLAALPHTVGIIGADDPLGLAQALARLERALVTDGPPRTAVLIDQVGRLVTELSRHGIDRGERVRDLVRRAHGSGLTVVATEGDVIEGFGAMLADVVDDRLLMRIPNVGWSFGERVQALAPHLPPGRALARSLGEDALQIAVPVEASERGDLEDVQAAIRRLGAASPHRQRRSPPLGALPSPLEAEVLADFGITLPESVPVLGIEDLLCDPVPLDLVSRRGFLVVGGPRSGKSGTLRWLLSEIRRAAAGVEVWACTTPQLLSAADRTYGPADLDELATALAKLEGRQVVLALDGLPGLTSFEGYREDGDSAESRLRLTLRRLLTAPGEPVVRLIATCDLDSTSGTTADWVDILLAERAAVLLAPPSIQRLVQLNREAVFVERPDYRRRAGYGVVIGEPFPFVVVPYVSG